MDTPEPARSKHWHTVEREHLAKEPACVICGTTEKVQVHHTLPPFDYCEAIGRPDLELDERNLFTLCEIPGVDHHILIGHLDDFKSWNPDFMTNHLRWKGMTSDQIRQDPLWQHLHQTKPPHVRQMSPQQIQDLRKLVDKLMPPDPAVLSRFGIKL